MLLSRFFAGGLAAATLAAMAWLTSPAYAQRAARFDSSSGSGTVYVSPGGHGFVGTLGPDGRWHGVTTDGAVVDESLTDGPFSPTPGVTFFDPNDRHAMRDHVPFVRFGADGRVRVDMTDGFAPQGVLSTDVIGHDASLVESLATLCRAGEFETAWRLAESSVANVPATARAIVAWRAGQLEEAEHATRAAWRQGQHALSCWTWSDVRPFFNDEAEYRTAMTECHTDGSLPMLTATQRILVGRYDLARDVLTSRLATAPSDADAQQLLRNLPPELEAAW